MIAGNRFFILSAPSPPKARGRWRFGGRGTILAARPPGDSVINFGAGRTPVTLLDFIRMIEERLGRKAEIVWKPMSASEIQEAAAEIARAKRFLGWEPAVDPAEGLDATVQRYLANFAWASPVEL